MEDSTLLVLVGIGAIAVYALRKPISDLTTPVGSVLSDVASRVHLGGEAAGDIVRDTVKYYHDLSQIPGAVTEVAKSYINPPQKTIIKAPVTVSKQNTIYTNPQTKVQKRLDLTSAQQMVELSKNPKIQNIATNVGNTTVYTPKTVQLPPSLLAGVLG